MKFLASLIIFLLSAHCGASTATVAAGADLQAAIDASAPGDTIQLAAGATFVGPFHLPSKLGSAYVTIRTSAPDSALPAPGHRIDPSYAPQLPKLVSPGSNQMVMSTLPGAHHWRLLGLELCPKDAATVSSELLQLGDGNQTQNDLTTVPHDFIVDRCYIHGQPTNGSVVRGVCLQCGAADVRNCWICDIHSTDRDTQAIAGWNGPGPFLIDNNQIEAAGENILFGGADPGIQGLTPSDIVISNNTIRKPLSWRMGDPTYGGIHWLVKNLFEIKNAQRVTVDHNLFENNWVDGQAGYAINLKSSNQNGAASWSVCRDVSFTDNIIRHSASGIGIGRDPLPVILPSHISFRGNKFLDISGPRWGVGGEGNFLLISWADYVTVDRNFVAQSGLMVLPTGPPMNGFVFTNNVIAHSTYGVKGGGLDPGKSTLEAYWPGSWTVTGNVIIGHPSFYPTSLYPDGNTWPDSWADVAAEAMGANR